MSERDYKFRSLVWIFLLVLLFGKKRSSSDAVRLLGPYEELLDIEISTRKLLNVLKKLEELQLVARAKGCQLVEKKKCKEVIWKITPEGRKITTMLFGVMSGRMLPSATKARPDGKWLRVREVGCFDELMETKGRCFEMFAKGVSRLFVLVLLDHSKMELEELYRGLERNAPEGEWLDSNLRREYLRSLRAANIVTDQDDEFLITEDGRRLVGVIRQFFIEYEPKTERRRIWTEWPTIADFFEDAPVTTSLAPQKSPKPFFRKGSKNSKETKVLQLFRCHSTLRQLLLLLMARDGNLEQFSARCDDEKQTAEFNDALVDLHQCGYLDQQWECSSSGSELLQSLAIVTHSNNYLVPTTVFDHAGPLGQSILRLAVLKLAAQNLSPDQLADAINKMFCELFPKEMVDRVTESMPRTGARWVSLDSRFRATPTGQLLLSFWREVLPCDENEEERCEEFEIAQEVKVEVSTESPTKDVSRNGSSDVGGSSGGAVTTEAVLAFLMSED